MNRLTSFLLFMLLACSLMAQAWTPDILGDGFEMRHVAQPDDYSGKVRSTIVRKLSGDSVCCSAVLYIHGYNDYFFQSQMADSVVAHGYNFYAVDLRKYGRSYIDGQRRFELRDISEYYADIDSALTQICADGNSRIFVKAHSTGGLIASCYLSDANNSGKYPIAGLILNSPFLDMNLGCFTESVLVPVVSVYSRLLPNTPISQGSSNLYAQSLLKQYHGEWTYNTSWKLEISPDVTSGWIGAIHRAHCIVQGGVDVGVPVLLMHSDRSVAGDEWSTDFSRGDAVLDVDDIDKYGRHLTHRRTTILIVKGGLHDLVLSRKAVRCALYPRIFGWMEKQ